MNLTNYLVDDNLRTANVFSRLCLPQWSVVILETVLLNIHRLKVNKGVSTQILLKYLVAQSADFCPRVLLRGWKANLLQKNCWVCLRKRQPWLLIVNVNIAQMLWEIWKIWTRVVEKRLLMRIFLGKQVFTKISNQPGNMEANQKEHLHDKGRSY